MSLKILGLRQTICLVLPKIFCTTFKSISKFYAFGFLKFNQISARYLAMNLNVATKFPTEDRTFSSSREVLLAAASLRSRKSSSFKGAQESNR